MWSTPTPTPSACSTSFGTRYTDTRTRYCTSISNANCHRLHASNSSGHYPLASKIVVKNLPCSVGESSLLKMFSSFGQIADVKLIKDEATKKSKGYAFIQYTCLDDAVLALDNMDSKGIDGRVIHVEIAKLGKEANGYPRTCGPPVERQLQKDDIDKINK